MNPMFAAIKKRRESAHDHGEGTHKGQHADDKKRDEVKDDKSQDIAKGKPSSEEHEKIQGKIAEESQGVDDQTAPMDDNAVDSDAIAMDMLDSRFKNNAPMRPRNLHERVQTKMASNLKSKGKI